VAFSVVPFHVNEEDLQDPDEIVQRITEPHKNKRLMEVLAERNDEISQKLLEQSEVFI
jgi:hypothetical protein